MYTIGGGRNYSSQFEQPPHGHTWPMSVVLYNDIERCAVLWPGGRLRFCGTAEGPRHAIYVSMNSNKTEMIVTERNNHARTRVCSERQYRNRERQIRQKVVNMCAWKEREIDVEKERDTVHSYFDNMSRAHTAYHILTSLILFYTLHVHSHVCMCLPA